MEAIMTQPASSEIHALIGHQTPDDCRSEAGVTTGLVDALITICRVLAHRDLTQAREALADLTADQDAATVFGAASERFWRDRISGEIAALIGPEKDEEDEAHNDGYFRASRVARGEDGIEISPLKIND